MHDIKPDRNSDRIVARILLEMLPVATKRAILSDGPQAVEVLNNFTCGYAARVRDELIRLLWNTEFASCLEEGDWPCPSAAR